MSRPEHQSPESAAFDAEALENRLHAALRDEDWATAVGELAKVIRKGSVSQTEARLSGLSAFLEHRSPLAHQLGEALQGLLSQLNVGPALIESNMMSSAGFLPELGTRFVRKFLPELQDSGDLRTFLLQVFPGRDDHLKINSVPDAAWTRLLDAMGISYASASPLTSQVATSIRTLTAYASGLGLRPEVSRRLSVEKEADSPFLSLPNRVLLYVQCLTSSEQEDHADLLRDALDTLAQCRSEVEYVQESMGEHGTSLALTRVLFRLLRVLDRLDLLLQFIDQRADRFQLAAARLFREFVTVEKTRSHILPHIRRHVDLLAYQVVEHAARKGGKYITSGRADYGRFFLASLGGGAIVAIFSLFKVALGQLGAPIGVEALMYGLNYSACFVLIYLTGSALATKQPAMTANTIAQALGERQDRHLDQLEALVIRVWRSQFVSFAGNLLMALPMAFAVSELFFQTKSTTVASPEHAQAMLQALHPWQSGSLIFAAVAGLFLFLAGLISGWVDNRNLYSQIPQRVAQQSLLVRLAGRERAETVGDFLHRNLGALTGNVFLGFALGSTGTIGEIFGLPLDIRHIAFASAEFGTALEILHFDVAVSLVWTVAAGVALIGLVNFLVSFGLSLATALESRQITWREIRILSGHLLVSFFQRPHHWFFPPRDGP